MSKPRRRPPRAWVGVPKSVDPSELLGPRGLTEDVLAGAEEADDEADDADELAEKGNQPVALSDQEKNQETTDAFHRSLLSPERLARIESVIETRLHSVTVVLDRLIDPHNVAAILRTAEGMGIGTARLVMHHEQDAVAHRRVTKDADKWLSLSQVATGAEAARGLVARGFAVYAGHLCEEAILVSDLPVDQPIALLFGNEHEGPSAETLAACTGSFRIPMAGFTQSFNVSVAAAIAMFSVAQKRRAFLNRAGDLDPAQKRALWSRYLRLAAKLARRLRRPIPGIL
jgi:tRNA (guanosine-2'-O-)-methyltransferase